MSAPILNTAEGNEAVIRCVREHRNYHPEKFEGWSLLFSGRCLSFESIENHLLLVMSFHIPHTGKYNINMDLALYFLGYLGSSQFARQIKTTA